MFTIEFDLNLFGYHGLYDEETILGNEFNLKGIIQYRLPINKTIQIEDTLNYIQVYATIKQVFETPQKLLETVLHNLCFQLFSNFDIIYNIELYISKNKITIQNFEGKVGVKLSLNRNEYNLNKNI